MIEWSRVNELRDEIGDENLDEVIDLFLEEVEDVIARLRSTPDLTRLEEDLHFLKGSALNLGFSHFSDLCMAGEQMAAAGQAGAVDLSAILAGFDASKAAFEAGLPKRMTG